MVESATTFEGHTNPVIDPANVTASRDAGDTLALLEYLAQRDVPCPLCKYNLRGLSSRRCPECGRELRLSVGLVEPAMGAWIAAAVGLLPAAGFGVFIYVVIFIEGLSHISARTAFEAWMIILCVYAGCAPPAAAALIAFRRPFLQLAGSIQLLLALFPLLMDGAAFFTFLANIR